MTDDTSEAQKVTDDFSKLVQICLDKNAPENSRNEACSRIMARVKTIARVSMVRLGISLEDEDLLRDTISHVMP